MKFHFVLLAGGSGRRVGGDIPKQFQDLAGRPVLARALDSCLGWTRTDGLVLVIHGDWVSAAEELARAAARETKRDFETEVRIVPGGATRHRSTLRGIEALPGGAADEDVILIHDAARPYLETAELDRLADYFKDPEAKLASLASPLTDTIVRGDGLPGRMHERLNRDELFAVKTPQAIRLGALRELLKIPEDDSFTDLLSWGAAGNLRGRLIPSGPGNLKITVREDFERLEIMYRRADVSETVR